MLFRALSIVSVVTVILQSNAYAYDGPSSSCSNATQLQERISSSLNMKTGEVNQVVLDSLRGTLDDVISVDDALFLTETLQPIHFDSGDQGYNNEVKTPDAYAGLDLKDLASGQTFETQDKYERYLSIRETVRAQTEEALNLCPGTLQVHFTHISQKTLGGSHAAHADNCFYALETLEKNGQTLAVCNNEGSTNQHPYSNRVAASIVYLNDQTTGGYDGGQFYWADLSSGEPKTITTPKIGRMAYFTAGVENLHGALPVVERFVGGEVACKKEEQECPMPRRLALAMWYVANGQAAEIVPRFGGNRKNEVDDDDPNAPTKVLEIPVEFLKSSLRVALSFQLLGLQNQPAKGSWKVFQSDDVPLGMLFRDNTGMLSIRLNNKDGGASSIIFERHADVGTRPSLMYQLQESVLIHNILDVLHSWAFESEEDSGEEIKDEDRLLGLLNVKAIEEARTTLPARPG